MPAISAEGIMLRKYLLRETSYILVIFTRDHGKIRGVLKGARAPYPQFAGNFEIFTRLNCEFYRKKKSGLDLITGLETLDFFLPVRKDIERLTYANYFVELVDIAAADNDPNVALYGALADGLKLLSLEDMSPRRAARIFELNFLAAAGLMPHLEACSSCSKEEMEELHFSVKKGGVLCGPCAAKDAGSFKVLAGTVNFLRKIGGVPMMKARGIKVATAVGKETEKILRSFVQYHVADDVRSLKFLDTITRKGLLEKGH